MMSAQTGVGRHSVLQPAWVILAELVCKLTRMNNEGPSGRV